jgi:hypothetical protein
MEVILGFTSVPARLETGIRSQLAFDKSIREGHGILGVRESETFKRASEWLAGELDGFGGCPRSAPLISSGTDVINRNGEPRSARHEAKMNNEPPLVRSLVPRIGPE